MPGAKEKVERSKVLVIPLCMDLDCYVLPLRLLSISEEEFACFGVVSHARLASEMGEVVVRVR